MELQFAETQDISDTLRQFLSAQAWGMYDAMHPPSTGAELAGAHEGAPRRNAFLQAERVGMGGEHRHALSGASITPENEQNKKQPQKPGKQRFPACKTCAPQTAQNAHTATVWEIRGTGTLRYGIAETSKVYKQHFNPDISVDTILLCQNLSFLTPFSVSN